MLPVTPVQWNGVHRLHGDPEWPSRYVLTWRQAGAGGVVGLRPEGPMAKLPRARVGDGPHHRDVSVTRSPRSGYARKQQPSRGPVHNHKLSVETQSPILLLVTLLYNRPASSSRPSLVFRILGAHHLKHSLLQTSSLPTHGITQVDVMASPRTTMSSPSDSPVSGQKLRQVWTPEEDRLLTDAVARGKLSPTNQPITANN